MNTKMSLTCVNCRHWYFTSERPAYSEVTPGTDWKMGCGKDHWIAKSDVSQEDFRQHLLTAEGCIDFKDRAEGGEAA